RRGGVLGARGRGQTQGERKEGGGSQHHDVLGEWRVRPALGQQHGGGSARRRRDRARAGGGPTTTARGGSPAATSRAAPAHRGAPHSRAGRGTLDFEPHIPRRRCRRTTESTPRNPTCPSRRSSAHCCPCSLLRSLWASSPSTTPRSSRRPTGSSRRRPAGSCSRSPASPTTSCSAAAASSSNFP